RQTERNQSAAVITRREQTETCTHDNLLPNVLRNPTSNPGAVACPKHHTKDANSPRRISPLPCGSPAPGAKETRQANNNASTQDSPMCGIVGAIAKRNITPILIEGLRRLEYRGYDSGVAVLASGNGIKRTRAVGELIELENALAPTSIHVYLGIARTRWATPRQTAHPMQTAYEKKPFQHAKRPRVEDS